MVILQWKRGKAVGTSRIKDLTKGSVFKSLLLFVVPIMLGNLLQSLYGAADKAVVGRFAENGALALAAVGGTTSVSYLIIGLFNGLGVGVNVICSNLLGARKQNELRKCMNTAIPVAVISGLFVSVFGILASGWVLRMMGTPETVFTPAKLYMQIYFVGAPAVIIHSFGSAILRSHGDTKRPMYILFLSGLVNVILNLVLVIGFHMSVDGVAIATAISQLLSAVMVLRILFDPKDQYKMRVRELCIFKKELQDIIRVGVPSGLGGMVFSVANVVIQSSVNQFQDPALLAGKSVVTDITGIIYQILAAMLMACVSYAGQCYGARNYKRIDKLVLWGCVICWALMGPLIAICLLFGEQVIMLFNTDPEVARMGGLLLRIETAGYLIYIPSEVFLGCSRGMRRVNVSTFLNFMGICVTRLIWVWVIFPLNPVVWMLFLCYPVSWMISTILQAGNYILFRRKLEKTT